MAWCLWLAAAALALRLAAVAAAGPGVVSFGDAQDYLDTATFICQEGGYPDRGNLPFFRAPWLPFLAAGLSLCSPDGVGRVKLGLAALDSVLPVLVLWLALGLTGSWRAARMAGVLAVVHPVFVWQVTDVRSEPPFTLWLTAALALLVWARRLGSDRLCFAAGIAAACAALTRPAGLVGIAVLALGALSISGSWRRGLTAAASLLAGAAMALSPWVVFMAAEHGELILVNDAGGYNLWRGLHPELAAALAAPDPETYRARASHIESVTSTTPAAEVDAMVSSPMARKREWSRRAVERMVADPWRSVRVLASNAVRYWRPWLNPLEHGTGVVVASAMVVLPLFLAGGVGLWRLVRSGDRWATRLVVGWLVVPWLAHAPFQVVMRFRVPFTDPLLLVLASHALWRAVEPPRREAAAL